MKKATYSVRIGGVRPIPRLAVHELLLLWVPEKYVRTRVSMGKGVNLTIVQILLLIVAEDLDVVWIIHRIGKVVFISQWREAGLGAQRTREPFIVPNTRNSY